MAVSFDNPLPYHFYRSIQIVDYCLSAHFLDSFPQFNALLLRPKTLVDDDVNPLFNKLEGNIS